MELNLLYFVLITTLLMGIQHIYGRKCTVKRRPDISIACEPWLKSDYRTVFQKGRRRDRKGRRGPPGAMGPKGEKGAPGPRGMVGPTGSVGAPGGRGVKGPKGEPGEKGDMGVMGSQGVPGIPGNCIMKNSLTNTEKYHCIAGPMGSQGPKGSQGDHGNQGKKGEKGDSGERGLTGPQGRRGAVGMPGLPGSSGIIKCSTHRTAWVGRRFLDDKSFDVFCPNQHFMQGFKLELEGIKQRYSYVCCKLR